MGLCPETVQRQSSRPISAFTKRLYGIRYLQSRGALEDQMDLPSPHYSISTWGTLDPHTINLSWQSCAHHNLRKTKPQSKSFKELIGPLGQRSKLAEPKYADSNKMVVAHVWGLWTRSVYFHPSFAIALLLWRKLTILDQILSKKSTMSPITSKVPILSQFARTISTLRSPEHS